MGAAWNVAAVTVLTSTPVFLPGAAHALIAADLGWSASRMGALLAVFWLGSLAGAYTSRRTGPGAAAEATIGRATLLTAAGLAAAAAVPEAGLWLGSAGGGCAYGYSQPHTNALLMRRCARRVQGLAFGLKQAAVPVAVLLCSLAVPAAAVRHGWRWVFAATAVLAAAYGTALLLRARAVTSGPRPGAPRAAAPLPWNRTLAALTGAGLLGAMVGNGLGGFLILSLDHSGLSLTAAGLVASAAAGLNAVVRIAAGHLTDRRAGDPWHLLTGMFLVGAAGTALLVTGVPAAAVSGALLAYAGGWGWAGLLHYIASAAYPGRENKATACTQMGVSLGALLGPLVHGVLYDRYGAHAWWALAAAGLAAAACAVTARRAHRAAPPRPPSDITVRP
ncbi:MFS transporter [Streptomyces sp. PRKS01-65]|nr:MFS transporter [Streptomyces harenosi]NEY35854.1 MFS transporter [Streptomyces harenosi]